VFLDCFSQASETINLKYFVSLAGLLASVPANHSNGANGTCTGTTKGPGWSSEDPTVREGTSQTGIEAYILYLHEPVDKFCIAVKILCLLKNHHIHS